VPEEQPGVAHRSGHPPHDTLTCLTALTETAPAFVSTAHRIVWARVATVDAHGRPWTRILHPLWVWDGDGLTGWIATDPTGFEARHLAAHPEVALTY
jgi:pyridoxine/pyridoxamine 5'-phosphate oxidase